jgi:AraC-like DNA-binding protein
MAVRGAVGEALRGTVSAYHGFREETSRPVSRLEGPGRDVVVIVSFGEEWSIDGERLQSFAAGLRDRQVATRHEGRSHGIHIDLSPPAAHRLFGLPLHELAERQVPLEDVLDEPFLVERLQDAGGWDARFRLLDGVLARCLDDADPPSREIIWAWTRLVETGGAVPIGDLTRELGWSRKRIVARFREEVGLPPKRAARLLRFERARALAESATTRPEWAWIACEAGYYDQSHLINDFRAFTGRTPETFFQDSVAPAA